MKLKLIDYHDKFTISPDEIKLNFVHKSKYRFSNASTTPFMRILADVP